MEVTIVLFPSMAKCLSVSIRLRALLLSSPDVGSCKLISTQQFHFDRA